MVVNDPRQWTGFECEYSSPSAQMNEPEYKH